MMMLSDTWIDLFTLAGLLNPLSLLAGAYMGWHADQPAKIALAGFAGATLSLLVETAWGLIGLPTIIPHDAGALAMFPFRFIGAVIVALIAYRIAAAKRA
ncbi:phosphatidylglycerophosphatase [Roseibium sp. CAU 1637]|uniref:Phosphatidylglycerophosphatase n=1 Tax=Roseibium limicola TaxID=2816037 RepID=A0A939EMR5_9HYPH|nr:phosphatidylglycerophosphatase [Roseibium limicola]MBO0344717.1 phosphatidylglycerophosphatase [Roseibium limicola]